MALKSTSETALPFPLPKEALSGISTGLRKTDCQDPKDLQVSMSHVAPKKQTDLGFMPTQVAPRMGWEGATPLCAGVRQGPQSPLGSPSPGPCTLPGCSDCAEWPHPTAAGSGSPPGP